MNLNPNFKLSKYERESKNCHKSFIIWFTGLSGSGKSTLAYELENVLFRAACQCYNLDGDTLRKGLCKDLDFEPSGRRENIRRVGEVCTILVDAGIIAITSFISPFEADREWVRNLVPSKRFIEVFCNCPLEVCESRDTKGLYKRARTGEIKNFTGIGSPYEYPQDPEIIVDTTNTVKVCLDEILEYLNREGYFNFPIKL